VVDGKRIAYPLEKSKSHMVKSLTAVIPAYYLLKNKAHTDWVYAVPR
jgi:hypothetical protein